MRTCRRRRSSASSARPLVLPALVVLDEPTTTWTGGRRFAPIGVPGGVLMFRQAGSSAHCPRGLGGPATSGVHVRAPVDGGGKAKELAEAKAKNPSPKGRVRPLGNNERRVADIDRIT